MGQLEGKVIAITGAGSGLGRESALLFAREGAAVVVSDVSESRAKAVAAEVDAAGGAAVAATVDVRSEPDVERLVAAAVTEFGGLHGAFANAGVPEVGHSKATLEDLSLDDWHYVIDSNLTGVFLTFKHAARHFKTSGGGTLLATSSAASLHAYPGFNAYAASKAGVNGLVRAAAFNLGRYNIRANALCPFHGMSINFALGLDSDVLGKSYEQMQAEQTNGWDPGSAAMPLRRPEPPTLLDNAKVALFLISDASGYLSGVCLPATDGGTDSRVAITFPADRGEGEGLTSGDGYEL